MVTNTQEICFATVNVRNNKDYDPAKPNGPYMEKPWSERKTRLVDAILATGPLDLLGCQEVFHSQLLDLSELLGKSYSHVGVGREDGKQAGEHAPIFFDNTKYELVEWCTIWLSPTPYEPGSIGWDAELPRIATLVTLRDRRVAGNLIHAVNTHYDHRGVDARAQSSLLIRAEVHKWVTKIEAAEAVLEPGVVLLFGDFNSPPHEKGFQNITSLLSHPAKEPSFSFLDSFSHLLSLNSSPSLFLPLQTRPYGPEHTYTEFGTRETRRIDFIMLGTDTQQTREDDSKDAKIRAVARGEWQVTRYACLDNFVEKDVEGWTGIWSDHRAVKVTIRKVIT
ncbi:hypothetical protein CI109_100856 [Kwoniella shandongensis]|uniref:Uncharacterized protein n=1 Tax=Kwoniella shandongensis TaxID=1734106 RepID=A0A5M6BVG1_9TREE|nr:uncharacterized protein CI109_006108 [Kwoniella shandongensis]KAA5525535.1 hypothetical protein CI109_006108 [Kwoniella shandongensis]